jgi:hypothetical protein
VALSGESLSLVGLALSLPCNFSLNIECRNLTPPYGFCGALLSSPLIGGPPMAAIEFLASRSFAPSGSESVSNAENVFRAWSGSYFGLAGCGVRKPVRDGTE